VEDVDGQACHVRDEEKRRVARQRQPLRVAAFQRVVRPQVVGVVNVVARVRLHDFPRNNRVREDEQVHAKLGALPLRLRLPAAVEEQPDNHRRQTSSLKHELGEEPDFEEAESARQHAQVQRQARQHRKRRVEGGGPFHSKLHIDRGHDREERHQDFEVRNHFSVHQLAVLACGAHDNEQRKQRAHNHQHEQVHPWFRALHAVKQLHVVAWLAESAKRGVRQVPGLALHLGFAFVRAAVVDAGVEPVRVQISGAVPDAPSILPGIRAVALAAHALRTPPLLEQALGVRIPLRGFPDEVARLGLFAEGLPRSILVFANRA